MHSYAPRRWLAGGGLGVLLLAAALPAGADPAWQAAVAERDARNKHASAELMNKVNDRTQPPDSRYNHVITFGQSLASSAEGWPALSTRPGHDNLMLGDSTRSATYSGDRFVPLGEAAFRPLRAVVQRQAEAGSILSPEEIARLGRHAQEEGESVEIGALNMARRLYLQHKQIAADSAHLFVASNAATSGRSIAQLSKTGGTGEYRRVLQAVDQAWSAAQAEGASYSISAFFWLQGEYDYSHTNGGINDRERYKNLLRQLRADLNADTAQAIAGQAQMPAFLTYQTDAKSSVKDGSLAIGMAQWELARKEPGWYLVGPVYPYVDKGTHLSANGYRWFGQMLGKVYHRVVVERLNWQPLSPTGATFQGRDILIDFHVPHPPLVFDRPYLGFRAVQVEDQGFVVSDDQGRVALEKVALAADSVVHLRAARQLVGQPRIVYAGFSSGGAGGLRDSDPTVADSQYEYLPEQGMWPEANLPALVGKPYPLYNWSIAFEIAAKAAQTQATAE